MKRLHNHTELASGDPSHKIKAGLLMEMQHIFEDIEVVGGTIERSANPQGYGWKLIIGDSYSHQALPFDGTVTTSGTRLEVGQGYIYAGKLAEYNWPAAGDTSYRAIGGFANGTWILYFDITVDDGLGFFTSGDKPALASCTKANFATLNIASAAHIIIGEIEVLGGKVVHWKQRLRQDICVPVWHEHDTDGDAIYTCSYSIPISNQYANLVHDVPRDTDTPSETNGGT